MFVSILLLIFFLPVALLPSALYTFFSSREINEMGIDLENTQTTDDPSDTSSPARFICMRI